LLLFVLALRDHVEIGALDIGRQGEGLRQLGGRVVERHAAVSVVRQWQHYVGRPGSGISKIRWIELQLECAKDDRVQTICSDDIAEARIARLRGLEERAVVGEIAFYMPRVCQRLQWLGGSAKVDVDITEEELSRAVVLHSRLDGEVCGQDDLGPWSWALRWRSICVSGIVEILKGLVGEQRYYARLGIRTRYCRVCCGLKRRPYLELAGCVRGLAALRVERAGCNAN